MEHRFEAPLFIPIVQEHNWNDPQRSLAISADPRFTLEVLHETVRKVVGGTRTTSCLVTVRSAMRTREFNAVFLRVAVKRRPSRIAKTNGFC
jgi:hypothetical protein